MILVEERQSLQGFTVTYPLRRIGGDFEAHGGALLVAAAIRQVVGTRPFELPWRQGFGIELEDLRNANMNEENQELARVRVEEGLRRWEPRIDILRVHAETQDSDTGNKLLLRVSWQIVTRGVVTQVLVPQTTTEVTL